MRILQEGDKSQAVCLQCKKLSNTTFRYDTYEVPDSKGKVVENVLLGFCDTCGTLASIPAQSSPKIRNEIRKNDIPVEARVQLPLEDILYAVSSNIRIDTQLTMRILLNFFLQEWSGLETKDPVNKAINSPLGKKLTKGKAVARVASKVDTAMMTAIKKAEGRFNTNRSNLIKGVLISAGQNLVEKSASPQAKRFYKMASILGPVTEKRAA